MRTIMCNSAKHRSKKSAGRSSARQRNPNQQERSVAVFLADGIADQPVHFAHRVPTE